MGRNNKPLTVQGFAMYQGEWVEIEKLPPEVWEEKQRKMCERASKQLSLECSANPDYFIRLAKIAQEQEQKRAAAAEME